MNRSGSYNLQVTHPLIPRDQYYTLDRKLLTVHSDDRDICKWPHANHFEIELPEIMTDVQSMRLVEISMPVNYYTFANNYQNTKFIFTIREKDPQSAWRNASSANWGIISGKSFEVEIGEGFYCPDELACEIEGKMNEVITRYLRGHADPSYNSYTYDNFQVYYDKVSQTYWFGNIVDDFQLKFGVRVIYDLSSCEQPTVWEQYTKWGLPSYLGFERQNYGATGSYDPLDPSGVKFYYPCCPNPVWLAPKYTDSNASDIIPTGSYDVSGVAPYIQAPLTMKILGERAIYMEVEKCNNYTELDPYSERTSHMYNNDYRGRTNSAFAKIPITTIPHGEIFDSRNGFLQNIVVFDPPLERINKLKFKFRYHDGRLVEFKDFPFNFTIAFNRLQNEIPRSYNIRVPPTFVL